MLGLLHITGCNGADDLDLDVHLSAADVHGRERVLVHFASIHEAPKITLHNCKEPNTAPSNFETSGDGG